MPRPLDGDHESAPGENQPVADAYAMPNRQFSFPSMLLLLVGALVVKNVLFHDYRVEEISVLKSYGKTDDQIHRHFVPKTYSERKQKQMQDVEDVTKMKEDIQVLRQEVNELRELILKKNDKNLDRDAT